MHYKHFAAGLLLLAGTVLSCKKEKSDYYYDNRPDTTVNGSSLVRLVNLTGNNQLAINGDSLTNFLSLPMMPGGGDPPYPGTYWFPDNGRMGTTYTIPRRFLQSGKAFVVTDFIGTRGARDSVGFNITEQYNQPVDYYILKGNIATEQDLPRTVAVPRGVTAPAKAGYFKIRLVNMADKLKPEAGQQADDIAVPLTLAYADGTVVSTVTSNIGSRQYSEYIELPYGAYQFKVLTDRGTQVTATGGTNDENTKVVDPATSTLTKGAVGNPHTVSTYLTYAPVRTFQPGGIYTIAVGISSFTVPYYVGQPGETVDRYLNGFRIIADISEPANVNYFRLQTAHVLPGEGTVTFRMNGQRISELAYAAHSEYGIYINGMSVIEAVNAQGAVIASAEMEMQAGLNYTTWLYNKPDGKPALSIVSNNLSGGYYSPVGGGQDGVNARRQESYPFHMRFLNFCADLPYVSFTVANGQPFGGVEATRNLEPGKTPLNLPYARFSQALSPYQFMAYRSTPTVYPGSWITAIPVLKSEDFIARPALYGNGKMPVHEPGIYTVALIGRLNDSQPEAQQAKMIIVKHTK